MKWVVCVLVAWAVQANAGLIAYEGFDYTGGASLNLQNGGSGFSSAWTNDSSAVVNVSAPGFTYDGLPTVGNSVLVTGTTVTANSYRYLSSTLGTDSTTVWMSLIGQRVNNGSARYFNFALFNGGTEGLAVGEPSNRPEDLWSLRVNATGAMSNSTASIYSQAFLLVRIDFGASNSDTVWMWANPDLSLGEPAVGTAEAYLTGQNLTFNRLRLSAGNYNSGTNPEAIGYFDEFRLGDTYLDVIPEPATGLLAAVGLAFLAVRRRLCR